MTIVWLLITACLSANWYEEMESVHLTSDSQIAQAMKDPDTHYIIEFFGPQCHFCKQLAPDWSKLAKEYKEGDTNITMASVNAKSPAS